ncbi:MAG: cysteine hydrolase [Sedimentisphaerales bacterium]|nr:cysteine hydrolase [Sedimentisphaerales bacterium]
MKRALLVIDVQNVYFNEGLKIVYPAGSLDNIVKAMDGAASHGVPIIVIQHSADTPLAKGFQKGSETWKLHPEIEKRKRDVLIEKTKPGSFTGTDLEQYLRENEIDTITISGYMTQMCCDTTARQAFHLDFAVEFLSDATGTLGFTNYAGSVTAEQLHNAIVVTQALRFSKVMSTQDWLANL